LAGREAKKAQSGKPEAGFFCKDRSNRPLAALAQGAKVAKGFYNKKNLCALCDFAVQSFWRPNFQASQQG
jgi:hypothetical protein